MAERKQDLTQEKLFILYHEECKTLQDIGNIYGITRERVRQLMRRFDIKSRNHHKMLQHPYDQGYKDLEDYFNNLDKRQKDVNKTLCSLIEKTRCSECGGRDNLDIHHINYPALSMEDIQILCRSCHNIKHKKNITYKKQILLYNLYIKGVHYKELMKFYGISQAMVYKIIRKIKKGHRTYVEEYRGIYR